MPIILFLLFIGFSVAADSMAPEVMVGEELGVSSQKVSSYRGSSPGGSSTETHSDGEERGGTGDSPPSVSRRFSTDLAPKATPLAASSGWESGEVPVEERAKAFLAQMEALTGTITLADVPPSYRVESEALRDKAFKENDIRSFALLSGRIKQGYSAHVSCKEAKVFALRYRAFLLSRELKGDQALKRYEIFYNILRAHMNDLNAELRDQGVTNFWDIVRWLRADLVREGLDRFDVDLSVPEPEPDLDYTGDGSSWTIEELAASRRGDD
jgi:hypothetical protein